MKNKINILVILSFALVFTGLVSADAGDEFCGMGGMMSGVYGFGGMFFGWIFGILVLVALVLLIVWLIKQIQKPHRRR